MDPTAAKQFLISKVLEESDYQHVSLSEVERKMLYFTEIGPSLPNIYEVNAEFERSYDPNEYESKIASLLRGARNRDRDRSQSFEQPWKDALETLRKEDHYILVMVRQAFGATSTVNSQNRFRDLLIYVAIGIGLVLTLFLISMWRAGH
jgi:hypothetical protein